MLFIQETRCGITLFYVNPETTGSHKGRISYFISYKFQATFPRDELWNIFSSLCLVEWGKWNRALHEIFERMSHVTNLRLHMILCTCSHTSTILILIRIRVYGTKIWRSPYPLSLGISTIYVHNKDYRNGIIVSLIPKKFNFPWTYVWQFIPEIGNNNNNSRGNFPCFHFRLQLDPV